jgi:D-alanyl-D-alanine carboxypeptidase
MDVNELLSTVKKKPVNQKSSQSLKKEDKSFDNVMTSISQNWEKQPDSEILKLKEELEKAKEKIQNLESLNTPLTKNEEKIVAAIRSESLNQKNNSPIISYNKFRKEYKVSSDYYRPSISNLLNKGIIKQEEALFSGNVKTFRWTILES